MPLFKNLKLLFCGNRHKHRQLRKHLSKKTTEYKVELLDGTFSLIHLTSSSLACDLLKEILLILDIAERDYFSLLYQDKNGNNFWIDPIKKLSKITKDMKKPYEFKFCVKFYAIDPDELVEELTRYHFYLQSRQDIKNRKLIFNDSILIELSALLIQSDIGDYEDSINDYSQIKDVVLFQNPTDDIMTRIMSKHKDLTGYNPGQCEIEFLKRIKLNDLYGVEFHDVKNKHQADYRLGFSPRGIMLFKENEKVDFYHWNRINMISFKKKEIKILVHNKLDPNVIDKCYFLTQHYKIAKNMWKLAIEHHSFFRLIKSNKEGAQKRTISALFSSRYRYSGRTYYEATEDAAKLSGRKTSFKRSRTMSYSTRLTVGYIRVGSRVLARAENGEYFKGVVVAMSDKVYVKCDDGVTIAHHKNTIDGILFDSSPDAEEIGIGTRVAAKWPGISNYLPGNIKEISTKDDCTKYLISFDDGDHLWNKIDQIRLLKPPKYFGPGSNTSYLEKKFSMIKTTTLVNSQINQAERSFKATITSENNENSEEAKENIYSENVIVGHPRTTSVVDEGLNVLNPSIGG